MDLIKILCVLILIPVIIGCTGCFGISSHQADSLNVEMTTLKSSKTAVIVPLFGEVSEKWAIDVETALQNPQYNLVVLWIESPGGGVVETLLLTHKLKVLQKKYNKQIYIYSEKILASGAYWVASAFSRIIVSPVSRTGSIGVYMVRADFSELYDKFGIKYHYIASDSTKVMGNSSMPMKDWEKDHWQKSVAATHYTFMLHVWKNRTTQLINAYQFRNMRSVITRADSIAVWKEFRLIANGIVYSSKYAALAGLVDGILYFDEFVNELESKGFIVVTIEGKVIDDFYPFNGKENSAKEVKQEIWERSVFKQNKNK